MNFPVNIWTRLISHIVQVPITKATSHQGEPLHIHLIKGRLQLSTDKAVYSFDDKYDNFVDGLKAICPEKFRNTPFLILGGGLGSVPYILERKHSITPHFTIVEIDIAIIHLFNQFTKPRLQSDIDIHAVDAERFVHNTSNKYGVIVIDLFIDDCIPDKFQTKEFLSQCRQALLPHGVILFNWMTVTKAETETFFAYKTYVFDSVLRKTKAIKTKYNHILIGYNSQ